MNREHDDMIENVGSVTIFIRDQEKSKDFYTKQLGMELRQDEPMPTRAVIQPQAVK